jgi:hypothetical protein
MEEKKIRESGILKTGEEITEQTTGKFYTEIKTDFWGIKNKTYVPGALLITNKRFLFLKNPGFFSSGIELLFQTSLGDILSISTSGLIEKKLNLTINHGTKIETVSFYRLGLNNKEFAKKVVEHKNAFIEEKTVDAKRVIIEEANKDSATQILQKKLARGEIALDEFHDKIQRT